jgi:hypothetical protein
MTAVVVVPVLAVIVPAQHLEAVLPRVVGVGLILDTLVPMTTTTTMMVAGEMTMMLRGVMQAAAEVEVAGEREVVAAAAAVVAAAAAAAVVAEAAVAEVATGMAVVDPLSTGRVTYLVQRTGTTSRFRVARASVVGAEHLGPVRLRTVFAGRTFRTATACVPRAHSSARVPAARTTRRVRATSRTARALVTCRVLDGALPGATSASLIRQRCLTHTSVHRATLARRDRVST